MHLPFNVIIGAYAESPESSNWYGNNFCPSNNSSGEFIRLDSGCDSSAYVYKLIKGPGVVEFLWRKEGSHSPSFDLAFYVNDSNISRKFCPNTGNWKPESCYIPADNKIHAIIWELSLKDNWKEGCDNKYKKSIGWIRPILIEPETVNPRTLYDPPEIIVFSGADSGYTGTDYPCLIKTKDSGNKIAYMVTWGDGSNSTGKIDSDSTLNLIHNWDKVGNYNVTVVIWNNWGISSSMRKSVLIKRLVKIPPGDKIQQYIDKYLNNTTFILEGRDYDGPIILNQSININIFSQVKSRIYGSNNYTIGIDNCTGINISGLDLSNSPIGIRIQYSNQSEISNNTIYVNPRINDEIGYGIYLSLSDSINISDNQIISFDKTNVSVGVMIERSKKNKLKNHFNMKNKQIICLTEESCFNEIDISDVRTGKIFDNSDIVDVEDLHSKSVVLDGCNTWLGI